MNTISIVMIVLELRRAMRTPSMLIPALLLPPLLLMIAIQGQSLMFADQGVLSTALSKFITFSVQASSIHALTTSVAMDREMRYFTILRSMPISIAHYGISKCFAACCVSTLSIVFILITMLVSIGMAVPWHAIVMLICIQLLGAVPIMMAGAIIGGMAAPAAAAGFASLYLFPLGYLSSLLDLRPYPSPSGILAALQHPPPFHAARLAQQVAFEKHYGFLQFFEAAVSLALSTLLWTFILVIILRLVIRRRGNDGA
jgi:hypothetical protein